VLEKKSVAKACLSLLKVLIFLLTPDTSAPLSVFYFFRMLGETDSMSLLLLFLPFLSFFSFLSPFFLSPSFFLDFFEIGVIAPESVSPPVGVTGSDVSSFLKKPPWAVLLSETLSEMSGLENLNRV
jgi:hypothetical protein